ncbi:MAG TPA: trypsin-like peptidase domain-containing protein [Gaiellaceae bacterium]
MRPGQLAAVSLVAAVIGGALVLAVARASGWLNRGRDSATVVRVPAGAAATPVVVAKPLAGNGFAPAQIYRARAAGVVTIYSAFGTPGSPDAVAGVGSGFVVGRAGTILTSAHVITTAGQDGSGPIARARTVYVRFADGDRVPARIAGYDLFDDVGVLRVDPGAHRLAPVPLGNSSRVVVGQPVAVIGSPFGNPGSLSVGVVSATGRSIPSLVSNYDLVDAIQTDAPINHGNSGGPLLDARGRVVGINAQIRSTGNVSGFEGVGFAVPIDSARRSLRQLLRTGKVTYAYVGITTEDLTRSIAKKFGYAVSQGALIDSFAAGDPAGKRAGLKAATRLESFEGQTVRVGGDAIVAIDGIPVRSAEDVVRIVAERLEPGETAAFTVVRGHRRLTVPVELDTRPGPAG